MNSNKTSFNIKSVNSDFIIGIDSATEGAIVILEFQNWEIVNHDFIWFKIDNKANVVDQIFKFVGELNIPENAEVFIEQNNVVRNYKVMSKLLKIINMFEASFWTEHKKQLKLVNSMNLVKTINALVLDKNIGGWGKNRITREQKKQYAYQIYEQNFGYADVLNRKQKEDIADAFLIAYGVFLKRKGEIS